MTNSRARRMLAGATLALGAWSLGGCAFVSPEIPELQRDATGGDALPAGVDAGDAGLDPASIRFAGEIEGSSVYVGRMADGPADAYCVAIIPPEAEEHAVGCGGGVPLELSGPSGVSVILTTDGSTIPSIYVQLSESVYAFASSRG